MALKSLTLALISLSSCTAVLAAPTADASTKIILKDLARPRYFGTAANTTFLFNDTAYTNLIFTQYSAFTPENEMKWESIEPEQNHFNFGPADEIVGVAHSLNARVRGHNLIWNNQLAPWVTTNLTAVELDRALQNHISKILNHYRGKLYAFDVVNELISDNTPAEVFKQGIWLQKFGESAIPKALTYARAADSELKLYINEYGIEGINSKSDALFNVVQGYLKDGVPLNGIGFQSHFGLGQVPATLQQNLQRFADLGLDVAITELDINIGTGNPQNVTAFAIQAQDYWTVVNACVKVTRCVGVTTWGVSDDHSWLPNGAVLPFDANKQPKPAFFAIADAFQGKPKPPLPSE